MRTGFTRAAGLTASLICLLTVAAACAVNPVSGQRELMLLSESQEIQLGEKTDEDVVRQYGLYEDRELNAYIRDLGERLSRVSHRPGLDYEFRILDSPVINAFAVPGGYVYLTRGILAYLNSEAELAGVMGHEIGHITARHSAQQYSRSQLAQLGLGLGMAVSETLRGYGEALRFGVGMMFLKFSRDDERQADRLGVEYASRLGYDATRMASFFDTLERRNPEAQGGLPAWFSTHPNPEDRKGNVTRRGTEWQRELGIRDPDVGRDRYLGKIDGLIFGEDPRQGYVEEGRFYHPELRFQFPVPEAWKIENTPSSVRMGSPERDALMLFRISKERSPRAGARAFLQDNEVALIDSGEYRVSGFPAYYTVGRIRSGEGILGIMSYFIQMGSRVYAFHGLSPVDRFGAYRPVFRDTMEGFRMLRDSQKLNVSPRRVRIRSAPGAGTLEEALGQLGVKSGERESAALLNGMNLNDRVPEGTWLKTVAGE